MNELDIVEIFRTPRRIPIRRGDNRWYWRYKAAGNHKIMATGAEGYENLADICESAARVLHLVPFQPNLQDGLFARISRQGGWPDVLVVINP